MTLINFVHPVYPVHKPRDGIEVIGGKGKVRLEIRDVEVKLTQAIHRQTLWMIGSVGAVIGLIRLLEWFLVHLPKS
ncbi:MAG: hypothetical protein PHE55_18515 [Methylococcaceae bacterium]|nr:hypothetical protein [Methylococcaceae bacterium]